MADFKAKAMEIINSVPGADWRKFAELGECKSIVRAIATALAEAVAAERTANIEALRGLMPLGHGITFEVARGALEHGIRVIRMRPCNVTSQIIPKPKFCVDCGTRLFTPDDGCESCK